MLKKLQEFGLDEKESAIYIALLKLGKGRVSEIARSAKIHRSSAYNILESLVSKRLVSMNSHLNRKYYVAKDPQELIERLQEKRKEYDRKISSCVSVVGDLSKIYKAVKTKPMLRYYDGTQGLIDAYEDTLTSSETIRAYSSIDDIEKCLPGYFPEYYRRRARKGIHLRAIWPTTIQSIKRRKFDKVENRTSVLIPKNFDFHLEINIYDNKMAIISIKERFAIIIESKELAYAQKQIFDLAWEMAEVYDKKIFS